MGYRRARVRPVPWPGRPVTPDGRSATEARARQRWPAHQPAGEEPPPAPDAASSDARRRPAPDRRRGQRPPRPRRPVPRRHRRGVRPVRRRPGRPVDVRRLADAAAASAAQRGLSQEILELVDTLPRDAKTLGMDAIREQQVRVLSGDLSADPAAGCGRSTDGPASARSASSRSCSATCRSGCSSSTTSATTPGRPTRPSSPARSPTTWRPPSATPGWPNRRGR